MILIDLSNIFYRSLFGMEKQRENDIEKTGIPSFEINTQTLAQSMLKEIRYREDELSDKYGRIILCADSRTNWRNNYFQYYKQSRKDSKANDGKDWTSLFNMFENVKNLIAENTYYVMLEVDDLEADDIIALCCKYNTKDKIVIVSLDKDLNQLIDGRIKQFSPRTNDFIKKENIHLLNESILTGDVSDGVPNIFSDDDHFVNKDKGRAKPVTSKLKEYFRGYNNITDNDIVMYFDKSDYDIDKILHNFKRNKTLIDLSMIPETYIEPFKQNLTIAIKKANLNKNNHEKWCDMVINNVTEPASETEYSISDMEDLF